MQNEKDKPSEVDAQPDKPAPTEPQKDGTKPGASETEAKPDPDEAPEEAQSPT